MNYTLEELKKLAKSYTAPLRTIWDPVCNDSEKNAAEREVGWFLDYLADQQAIQQTTATDTVQRRNASETGSTPAL